MGAILKIKDANFSENGVLLIENQIPEGWFITEYLDNASLLSNEAYRVNGGWAYSEVEQVKVRGKWINTIRFRPSYEGNLPLLVGTSLSSVTQKANITISSSEVKSAVTKTFTPIFIEESEYVAIGVPNGAGFYYRGSGDVGFYTKVPSDPTLFSNGVLGIDLGYFEVEPLQEGWFITQYTDYTNALTLQANRVNGGWAFNDEDQAKVRGKWINTVKFKASYAGNFPLLVGTSLSSVTQKANITISSSEVGSVVTKTFTPIFIENNEYLAVCNANDGAFYYGNAVGSGGFYTKVPSNPNMSTTNITIGIDVGYITTD